MVVGVKMMSKGLKEALTVLIVTHVARVERVERSLNSFNCYSSYSCRKGQKCNLFKVAYGPSKICCKGS